MAIAGRSLNKAQQLAQTLNQAGFEAIGLEVDAKSVSQIKQCVDAVVDNFGSVDILMNCVGIQREQPLLEVTEEAFDEVYEVNLKAAMFLAQAVAKHQIAAAKGANKSIYYQCVLSWVCVIEVIRRIAQQKGD